MYVRDELLTDINTVLELLASPPDEEVRVGWDEDVRNTWSAVFGRLRDAVLSGNNIFPEYDHVIFVRGLDLAGICGGVIFDLASDIDAKLREVRRAEATKRRS